MIAPIYVLAHPWGLYGTPQLAKPDSEVNTTAGQQSIIAAPDDIRVSIGGRRLVEHPETPPFLWAGGTAYTLRSIPVGVRQEDSILTLSREDTGDHFVVRIEGHIARPQRMVRQSDASVVPASRLEALIQDTYRRIETLKPAANDQRLPWDRLQEEWLDESREWKDPPEDVIVRHAESLRSLLTDLASHPRRILSRRRELVPIAAAQEIDAHCIRWLIRQPGRTVAERAGGSQRILAVARYENRNTIENRVLRDLLTRSALSAASYIAANERFAQTARYHMVGAYGRECDSLGRELASEGIGLPSPPITPNYVLLYDPRYRRVWKAYQELLRCLEEQDEIWRWQRRLWSDFCVLFTHIALDWLAKRITAAPIRLRRDQARGQWSSVQDQTGLFFYEPNPIHPRNLRFVLAPVTVRGGTRHLKVEPWHASLGPAAVIVVSALDGHGEATILVWALHATGDPQEPLPQLCRSAADALAHCLDERQRRGEPPRVAAGIIVRSVVDPCEAVETACAASTTVCVRGIALGPHATQLIEGVDRFGEAIEAAITAMFP